MPDRDRRIRIVCEDRLTERVPLKEDNESAARMILVAANNWRAAPPLLPSLEDAYVEGQRIGM